MAALLYAPSASAQGRSAAGAVDLTYAAERATGSVV